jgi:hypothetical protein
VRESVVRPSAQKTGATKRKAARPSRRAAEILSDVISVAMNDTRGGFFIASVISLQKIDAAI